MKHKKLYEVILIISTIVILYFLLKDNFSSTMHLIKHANLIWMFLAALVFTLSFSLEAVVTNLLIKQYKKNYSFKKAFRLSLVTKFFNGVTPLSTGGRPLLVFELKKDGIKAADGTNVVVQNFMLFQISLIIFSILTFIVDRLFNVINASAFLNNMMFIGFCLNLLMLIIAIIFSVKKNINNSIIIFFINILSKLKIIRDKEKHIENTNKICMEYYNAFQDFKHNTGMIIKSILLEILALVCFYSTSIFILYSLGGDFSINLLACIIVSNYIFVAGSYIPLPGGTGGVEYAFLGYFKQFVSYELLSPTLILWRYITYYLPTLIGGILFNIKYKNE